MKLQQIVSSEVGHGFQFIIAPFAILISGKVLFELFAFKFPELNQSLIPHLQQNLSSVGLTETKARLQWLSSVILYFFVVTIFITFIINSFRKTLTKSTFSLFISLILLFSASEILYLFLTEPATSPIISIFRFTFDSLKVSGLYSESQLGLINITLAVINLLAIIVVPIGIMAGCCVMSKRNTHPEAALGKLIHQSKQIKNLLTGGSAVMVIGIMHMQLWFNWPLSLLTDETLHQQIQAVTFAVSQYWGLMYTLTMAALYFPAAFYLTAKAKIIILQGTDEQAKLSPEKWLAENHMLISPFSQLPQLIAMIAPMLIGSFGTSLAKLMPF
jgi:hypothetical protein